MNYEQTKTELSEIRSKERKARKELEDLQERQSSIDADVNQAYDAYLQAQADEKAGEASNKDVTKAEKAYLSLKSERDTLDKDIEVAQRIQSILKDKVRDAEGEFRKYAVPFHKEKLKPHFENIQAALDTINSEIEAVNSYKNNLIKDQVGDSVLKGITHYSKAVITKDIKGSIGFKNFITQINQ